MKKFSEFNIKAPSNSLEGDKISIERIVNVPIVVCDYRVENSKYPKPGREKCIWLQIELKGEKRVVFTPSVKLINMLDQVNKADFPFEATIIKENGFELR